MPEPMGKYLCIFIILFSIFSSCNSHDERASFTFEKDEQGVQLLENGQPVFFYQKMPKTLTGEYISNNYLHPLYSLNGDTLTEEFPADHPYHRGIFWAWHQIYINGKRIGDGWIMENIEQEVIDVQAESGNLAQMELNVHWKSPLFENGKPFMKENTKITVHPVENDVRKIDFAIALRALVPGVELGGSDDVKGYGGLCARLKLPEDLTFTSSEGPVTPKTEQIKAGPWMDFSFSLFGERGLTSGVSILCHPETSNYPAPWILRSKTSMQNIVFPGRDPVAISMDEPVVLYYRLIVHNLETDKSNINELQSEYETTAVRNN